MEEAVRESIHQKQGKLGNSNLNIVKVQFEFGISITTSRIISIPDQISHTCNLGSPFLLVYKCKGQAHL